MAAQSKSKPLVKPSLQDLKRRLLGLPATEVRSLIRGLPDNVVLPLLYDWSGVWARDKQLPPEWDWTVWLVLAGRGFGKSRCGAEWVRHKVETGQCKRLHLVAATAADVRDVMIEGESGILAISPPWSCPVYEPSKRRLTWPQYGAVANLFSADEPRQLRGPQCDGFWADELAAWKYAESWAQLQFGFRLGARPQGIVTTTPRPIDLIRKLLEREGKDVAVTRGTTYENRENLATAFFESVIREYEGTRLGRQELDAEVLEDNPGALWKRADIDLHRVRKAPDLSRIVVGIDPAVSSNANSDKTGIVVCGISDEGHGYVLDDVSGIYSPRGWAEKAVEAFKKWEANWIIAEINNGGELVEANLRTVSQNIPYQAVRASRGKQIRAEPIASLYEKGMVHHVGCLAKLEDQMCDWNPTDSTQSSPDRIDALVWALSHLMLKDELNKTQTTIIRRERYASSF